MPRVSEQHIIKDQAKFDSLLPKYLSIINSLQKKYPVSDGSKYQSLVNFKNNTNVPKHNWFVYKQGYAEELVRAITKENKPKQGQYILDPFCGVGTTNLVAQSMGYKSIGFDINPVAVLAAEVKTSYFTNEEKKLIKNYINKFKPGNRFELSEVPRVVKSSFVDKNLDALLRIRYFVEHQKFSPNIQAFFKLAFLSIIEDCKSESVFLSIAMLFTM